MPATPTPVIGYTIEFTVATNKVVHATDDNNQPSKYTHSPALSEDDLITLAEEVVAKAGRAFRSGQRTFALLIDERGHIHSEGLGRSAGPASGTAFGALAPPQSLPPAEGETREATLPSKTKLRATKGTLKTKKPKSAPTNPKGKKPKGKMPR